jgi:hypothetical protein
MAEKAVVVEHGKPEAVRPEFYAGEEASHAWDVLGRNRDLDALFALVERWL